jgi:hypothetical protein
LDEIRDPFRESLSRKAFVTNHCEFSSGRSSHDSNLLWDELQSPTEGKNANILIFVHP